MDIIIIGSGNVATIVGRKILSGGHRVIQVYSPDPDHAAELASLLRAKPIRSMKDLERSADLILVSIPDNAYASFFQKFPRTGSFVVHTAGSVPLAVLGNTGDRYGVLYPLQSLRKELQAIPEFPLLVDANDPAALVELKTFAAGLSNTVIQANDEIRLKYHVGAVLLNNFTNHLFALSEDWCRKEGIAFSLLHPLIRETVNRVEYLSPATVQTGPAIRNDEQTLEKHRQLLSGYPALSGLYEVLTRSIQQFTHNK
ncbi:MAG: Rossmann-like and DUF2520 domain-containing protein [Chitinophagales bacterium]